MLRSAGRMEGTAGDTSRSPWLEVAVQEGGPTPPTSQEGRLRQLLYILYTHKDRDAAIAAAFTAAVSLQ